MRFTTEDLKKLLNAAIETGRDLSLTFNADGTYEVSFNRPAKYITTTTTVSDEEQAKGWQKNEIHKETSNH